MSPPGLRAIFLRGVNVGGVTIKSAALRTCLESIAEIETATTILASGNAVVRTTLRPTPLRAAAEQALRRDFGYAAWVVVLDMAEIIELAERCPYALDDPSLHAYLTLASDPAALDAWQEVAVQLGQEHTRLSPVALAWTSPAGQSLTTPFAKAQTRQPLKQHAASVTTRNARTLTRVVTASAALGG